MAQVFITSGTSWAGVATDGSNITVEAIGGGGGAGSTGAATMGGGGGGGAYAVKSVAYVSSATVNGITIGQGGAGGVAATDGSDGTDTVWDTNVVVAKAGLKGFNNITAGAGGAAASCTPSTGAHSGGAGKGSNLGYAGNGGGGAAGSTGDGAIGGKDSSGTGAGAGGGGGADGGSPGGDSSGGTGGAGGAGANNGGSGGNGGNSGASSTAGSNGAAGQEWDATHGSGGGGGGGGSDNASQGKNGGNGGLYGGGGASNGYYQAGTTAGSGAQGIIAITYTAPSGIAFDAAANSGYQAAQSTYTFNRTCTGSNLYLTVDVSVLSAGQTVTSVIDDSGGGNVNMIFLGARSTVTSFGRIECWGLANPATGTKSIQVNLSSTVISAANAVSYTGVHQTSPTEGFNSNQATNVGAADATVSITSVADNCWIHAAVATDDTAITANQTSRNNVTGAGGSGADEDNNAAVTPAGATTMSYTNVGALATWTIAGYAIRPIAASNLGTKLLTLLGIG